MTIHGIEPLPAPILWASADVFWWDLCFMIFHWGYGVYVYIWSWWYDLCYYMLYNGNQLWYSTQCLESILLDGSLLTHYIISRMCYCLQELFCRQVLVAGEVWLQHHCLSYCNIPLSILDTTCLRALVGCSRWNILLHHKQFHDFCQRQGHADHHAIPNHLEGGRVAPS